MNRAAEIAQFLGIPESDAAARLALGFSHQHQKVNDDFRRANPRTDEELLEWYRTTTEYIWELSAYHMDPGFNYSGMCSGIVERLKNEGARRVLCLGDGIGDLTLDCQRAGLDAVYHDLAGSRTAEFARVRIERETGLPLESIQTGDFDPSLLYENSFAPFDAVVSLDYLEHVDGVPKYVHAIFKALRPGGLMMTQNAFGCGSGPGGSIPMHLTKNDIYVYEWDNLCSAVGFRQESSNWYRRPL